MVVVVVAVNPEPANDSRTTLSTTFSPSDSTYSLLAFIQDGSVGPGINTKFSMLVFGVGFGVWLL